MKIKNRSCIGLMVVTLVGVIACCSVLLILWVNASNVICFQTPFPSLRHVEERAFLDFPPSAHNIKFYSDGINRKSGCTVWVTFEMDSSDLEIFTTSTTVEELSPTLQLSGDAFTYFSLQRGWHQPAPSLAGHGTNLYFEEQWIFVDTSNPEKWSVYIIANHEWL